MESHGKSKMEIRVLISRYVEFTRSNAGCNNIIRIHGLINDYRCVFIFEKETPLRYAKAFQSISCLFRSPFGITPRD